MISSTQVKTLAQSLGFDACGITRAEPLPEAEERMRVWLREGRHGEMKYLEDFESRAKNFWDNFPEAKSVIVLGVNYYSGTVPQGTVLEVPGVSQHFCRVSPREPSLPEPSPVGRVARYAWGRDYHRVIGKRVEEFRIKLGEIVGRPFRAEICVDTKPLLERPLAQKAGLGFIGKQSQLLSPEFGPWLFLSELVTDLELEPDTPFVGSCGSCTICIENCPTEAIQPEGGIDARRCIAYLTIEHKGEIPETLRPLVGEWVFGCDLCLEVCPFTSKSKESRWPELKAESGHGKTFDLLKLFEISSNQAYEKYFEGTAVTRARRKQLLRNAAVVLGNLKAKETLPVLENASHHESELVAGHARWAIAQMKQA